MSTEPTATYPAGWDDAVDQIKLDIWNRIWDWAKDNLWIAVVLVLVVLLVKYVIVPALPDLFKSWVESQKERKQKSNAAQNSGKMISYLGHHGASEHDGKPLPKAVEKLAEKIEGTSDGTRYRYCVVCPDMSLATYYAKLFFIRMHEAAAVDKIGWVNYQRPRGENLELCAKHCMINNLNLENHIVLVDKRFEAMCAFFRKQDCHSLLIFRMYEDALDDDAELRQITGLDGLSVVLFAKSPVDGYENIVISKKGGKSA